MNRWQWLQLIGFNVFWLVSVLGQNQWLLIQLALLIVFFVWTPGRSSDMRILPVALVGILVDMLLMQSGFFSFDQFPWWLLLLWIGFVLSINHGFAWLKALPLIYIALIGAVSGPLSYLAGYQLQAVSLPWDALLSLMVLAVIWFFLLPLLLLLTGKINHE